MAGDYEFISQKLEQEVIATDPSLVKHKDCHRFICPNHLSFSRYVSQKVLDVSTCICELETNDKKSYEKLECPETNAAVCWNLFIQQMKTRE